MDNTDITEKALSIIDKFNHDRDIAKQQFNHDNLVEWHNRPNRPIGAVEARQIVLRGDTSEFHMLHDDLVRSFEEYACRFSHHIAPIKYIRKKYNWDSTKPD